MDDKTIPVVFGPGRKAVYAIDGHHTLAALDFSGYHGVEITISVTCNYENMSEADFWAKLKDEGFAYLYGVPKDSPNALPVPISPSELPQQFSFTKSGSTFDDDRWRAMVGFARKIQTDDTSKYQMRCMDRICDPHTGGTIPFFEYRWAYFFADAFATKSLWDDSSAFEKFSSQYNKLPAAGPGGADVEEWQTVSNSLLHLCRGSSAGSYSIPATFGIFSGKLPGYHKGMGNISPKKDNSCSPPVCPDISCSISTNVTSNEGECYSLEGFCLKGSQVRCKTGDHCSQTYRAANGTASAPCAEAYSRVFRA
jgi:hypothetical protein